MAATRNLERGGKSTGMHRHQEAASQADRMTNHRTSTKPDRRDRGSRPCASHHLLSSTLACCSPIADYIIAARRADTNRGYKKTSTRISVVAVGIALLETRREANACAFSSASAVQHETSYISQNDCVAAQIVYRAIARKGVGGFMRRDVARLWSGY